MTWAKLSDTFIDDPDLLALPRGVRLLYVESIVWSCKHETDGAVPAHVVHRITDEPEVDKAVDLLLERSFWSRTDTGFEIVGFLDDQISAEQVARRRADERLRQERSRRHKAADHSLCIAGRYCPEGAVTRDNTGDSRNGSRGESPTPVPSRPVPTSREGTETKTGAAPPAPLGSQGRAPSKGRGFTVSMPAPPPDPDELQAGSVDDALCEHREPRRSCPICLRREAVA